MSAACLSAHLLIVDFGLPLYMAVKQCENPLPVRHLSGMPTSMRLVKSVDWKDYPHSISHHGDITYVGTRISKVIALDRHTGKENVFVSIEARKPTASTQWKPYSPFAEKRLPTRPSTSDRGVDWGISPTVHNGLMYLLVNKKTGNHSVQVRDLTGKFLRKWSHQGDKTGYSKLRVVVDQLVIPNSNAKCISIYSLNGKLVKELTYPHLADCWTGIATCGDNSIVISDTLTGVVGRIDSDGGEILWTSTHVSEPEGVVCYKNRYVLVTNRNREAKIWILDVNSGL